MLFQSSEQEYSQVVYSSFQLESENFRSERDMQNKLIEI